MAKTCNRALCLCLFIDLGMCRIIGINCVCTFAFVLGAEVTHTPVADTGYSGYTVLSFSTPIAYSPDWKRS